MMRSILIFILLGQAVAALCQTPFVREKRDYIWPFGRGPNIESQQVNIWLDFSQTPPQSYLLPGSINLDIANAGICDVNGNLLFYTNGYVVMNGVHELMENGAGLAPGLMTNDWLPYGLPLDQGAIALPLPGSDSISYLIHARREYLLNGPVNGQSSGTFPLYYSVIVFDSLSPDGMVLEKNVVLTEMPVIHGKLTAVRHANGRDWWILVFKYFSNQYHRFLLSPEGIAELPMDSVGLPIPAGVGQAIFSPDGTKFAKLNLYLGPYVDIYSFDRCTGLLSQPVHFRYTESPVHGGLVFSPNSRYLYVSSDQYIYQYDTWAADIAASRETIVSLAANPTETDFALAQLGPDGKIYVSGYNIRDLHIIHNPNAAGAACEFEKKALSFDYILGRGIPNHPYYGLGPWDGSPCDTLGIDHHPQAAFRHREQNSTVGFWDYSLFFPTQWAWDFGDGSAGSTEQNPTHTYAAPGTYTVTHTYTEPLCGTQAVQTLSITVSECDLNNFSCPCTEPNSINIDAGNGELLLSNLIAAGIMPAGGVNSRCIAIRGSLRVDADYALVFCEVRMQPAAGIVVESFHILGLSSVSRNGGIYGCGEMWRGIRVEPQARLNSRSSWIADAQYAVEAMDKSNVLLQSNTFRRNYTGLFFNAGGEFNLENFADNTLDGADPLLPPFAGQMPAPGTRPFAGVDVSSQSNLRIGVAGAQPNRFLHLRNGIITNSTNTEIRNSTFEGILRTNADPNYPFTGHAVRHSGGAAHALTLQGLGKNAAATFHNCTEGVWATGTDVDVQEARMTAMSVGVTVRLASNRNIALKNNNISAGSTGISLQNNDPAQSILVTQNNVNIGESNKSVAIRVDETNLGHFTEAVIFDNAVSTLSEATGIRLRTAADYHIAENNITLSFPDGEAAGIRLLGVQESRVTANKIQGTGQLSPLLGGTGMDVRGSNDVFYDCNSLSNLHTGARFGDVCNGTEMQATMFSTPMRVGLHYLPGLTATPQLHEGNQWLTTGGAFGEAAARNDVPNTPDIADVLAAQRYEVHTTMPPFYPPSFAFPNLLPPIGFYISRWFPITQGVSDPCGAEPDMLTGGGEEELRLKIAQGGGFEGEYTAARLWQARRNLYAALAAQSGGVSGSLLSFYQNNQAGLQGGLYNIEYGKRELYQPAQMLALPMAALLEDMRQLADEIAEQDSLIWIEEGNEVFRQSLLTDFGMKARAVDSLEQLMLSARFTAADNLLQQNSLLPGSAIYETNALDLNALYLSIPSRSLADFTPEQMADLEFIAGQCPAAGGRSVWQARSLLALAGVDQVYSDDCVWNTSALGTPNDGVEEALIQEEKSKTEQILLIFPNPAQDRLTVRFQPGAAQYMQLADATGRPQWSLDVSSGLCSQGELLIDISRLTSGYYYFLFIDMNGHIHSQGISIIR